MATPINRLPLGLLGFLGIKNGGQYPTDLSNILLPVWDLVELYTNANAEVLAETRAINAIGSQAFTNLVVPNGEAWYVVAADCKSATLTAGQSFQQALSITDPAVTTSITISDNSPSQTTGARAIVGLARPGIWLGPGWNIGTTTTVLAAGPVNVTLGMRFARFQL